MTIFVDREEWGAKPREQGDTSITDHPSNTLHYVGGGWEWPWYHTSCDDKVRAIQADHMAPVSAGGRGWSDIAYNYLVCPHDYCFEGRGYDRRSSANGSVASNFASFAICALWGTNSADDPLPNGLKDAYLYTIALLQAKGGATDVIKGHRDWKQTDCPGDQIYAWIKAGCPDPTPPLVFEDEKVNSGMALSQEATRQIAATMVAVLDQEVKDGQSLHELVQMFSAFNAENTRQNVDQAQTDIAQVDTDVDMILKDDFKLISDKVESLNGQYNTMSNNIQRIMTALNIT
jgi:hypothetical protein